jgi:hypothetical protein
MTDAIDIRAGPLSSHVWFDRVPAIRIADYLRVGDGEASADSSHLTHTSILSLTMH